MQLDTVVQEEGQKEDSFIGYIYMHYGTQATHSAWVPRKSLIQAWNRSTDALVLWLFHLPSDYNLVHKLEGPGISIFSRRAHAMTHSLMAWHWSKAILATLNYHKGPQDRTRPVKYINSWTWRLFGNQTPSRLLTREKAKKLRQYMAGKEDIMALHGTHKEGCKQAASDDSATSFT